MCSTCRRQDDPGWCAARDLAGRTQSRLAAEQLAELVAIEKETTSLTKELTAMVLASGSTLMDLRGVGPVVAARTLADVGDINRFPNRNQFASWTGTAPWRRPPGRSSVTASPGPATGG